jgi:hypothetical protein
MAEFMCKTLPTTYTAAAAAAADHASKYEDDDVVVDDVVVDDTPVAVTPKREGRDDDGDAETIDMRELAHHRVSRIGSTVFGKRAIRL